MFKDKSVYKFLTGVRMKVILLTLIMVTTNIFAANIPVTFKATADNHFVTVLRQGGTRTLVYPFYPSDWRTPKVFTIQVSDLKLKKCSIDFITWSGGVYRGFAGTLSGNGGTLHTGDSLIKTYKTSIIQAGDPNSLTRDQIFSSMVLDQTNVRVPGIWGPPSNYGLDPAAKWISALSSPMNGDKSYDVHSFPCSSLVKKLITRPAPTPTPAPINVKGDHFACYMLEKGPNLKPEQVTIKDQFGSAKVVLGMPKMICNPSEKIHRKQHFGIENKERHLVCYEMLEQSPSRDNKLEIENQFEKRRVRSTNRELFCVPSLKRHL
jgi:hypothetical protein